MSTKTECQTCTRAKCEYCGYINIRDFYTWRDF